MKRTRFFAMSSRPDAGSKMRPSRVADKAFMVKSRRSASATKSRPKRHFCAASVSLHVAAQGGHFEWRSVDDDRHRAVLDAGRDAFETTRGGARHHDARRSRRGNVDVRHRQAHQMIADRAADDAGFLAVVIEQVEQPAQGRPVEETRALDAGRHGLIARRLCRSHQP